MTTALTVQVTDDWQRDALRLVPFRHTEGGVMVGTITTGPGATPYLRLVFQPHEEMSPEARDRELEMGVTIQTDVARALYEALGRHFGDHQDPASRELVDVLKDTQAKEAERVDLLLSLMVPERVTVHGQD